MTTSLHRRRLLKVSAVLGGLAGLGGCASLAGAASGGPPLLRPIRARPDRLFDLTVCLRPFRAAGPRMDAERIGDALVVHNYGHGGSGWSLSWGSAEIAVRKAMEASPDRIAVVGCGALGLTAATVAQRAGAKVSIYARELLPQTRSARATGMFTPDSRIGLANAVGAGFGDVWEQMARTSFKAFRSYLGLPGTPVEFIDYYRLADPGGVRPPDPPGTLEFAGYHGRILDLLPRSEPLSPEKSPFMGLNVARGPSLMFNIADYGHTLMTDFLLAGGQIRRREFNAPAEYATLEEKAVINCTGYGARALWKDESLTPVRGQIGWLIPQPEVDYGFFYKDVSVVPRRDGVVVQWLGSGDMQGYGDDREEVDRGESERAVGRVAEAMAKLRRA